MTAKFQKQWQYWKKVKSTAIYNQQENTINEETFLSKDLELLSLFLPVIIVWESNLASFNMFGIHKIDHHVWAPEPRMIHVSWEQLGIWAIFGVRTLANVSTLEIFKRSYKSQQFEKF